MALPFHEIGDFEHHHFAMTASPAPILQNLPDTTPGGDTLIAISPSTVLAAGPWGGTLIGAPTGETVYWTGNYGVPTYDVIRDAKLGDYLVITSFIPALSNMFEAMYGADGSRGLTFWQDYEGNGSWNGAETLVGISSVQSIVQVNANTVLVQI